MLERKTHLPCPECGSSDAYTEYADGGYCHSCNKKFKERNSKESMSVKSNLISDYNIQFVPYRNNTIDVLKFFNVHQLVSNKTGELLATVYPGPNGSSKIRVIPTKEFYWEKYSGPGLMFLDKFPSGGKAITITEGEEDALAVFQMFGCKYPVASVQSSGQAVKDIAKDKEKLLTYEKIVLCFDNDKEGNKAVQAVSAMLPFNKVYVVHKDKFKDASDYLQNNAEADYRSAWWAAKRHDPENIVSSFSDIEELFKAPKKRSIATFPFAELQSATYGIRTGETYLIKAMEGIGKTEFLGAIEYHVSKETDYPIGVFHLEEDAQRSAFRLVGYEVSAPVHLEGFTDLSHEQLIEEYKKVAKYDNRINFYQPGKNDNDVSSFLNTIRFMVASAGCKIVFFDHISRVATSFGLDTAGLDNFATQLSKMAIELDFALIMISHVNDDNQTRGSRNISKEAWTVVSLSRDVTSLDAVERNTTRLLIEKNRHASITGPAGSIFFDPTTFKLSDTATPVFAE